MGLLLLLVGIVIVALIALRPAPRPQVIYVPVEIAEDRGAGLGCLPLFILTVVALLALGVIRL